MNTIKITLAASVFALVAACIVPSAYADENPTVTIEVTSNGAAVHGDRFTIYGNLGRILDGSTNRMGKFSTRKLSTGNYQIKVRHNGGNQIRFFSVGSKDKTVQIKVGQADR